MAKIRRVYAGDTLDGRPIVIDATREDNWLRMALSQVSSWLFGIGANLGDSNEDWTGWARTLRVVDALRFALTEPKHYGENRPGGFGSSGAPLVADRTFTYADLVSFGASGEGGFARFLTECGLPVDTQWERVELAAGLLLVDDAVVALDAGELARSGYLLHKAQDCAEQATLSLLERETPANIKRHLRKELSKRGRPGGLKSAESRRREAKAAPKKVAQELARLAVTRRDLGDRDLNGIVAKRLGVTARHIARVRRGLKDKGA